MLIKIYAHEGQITNIIEQIKGEIEQLIEIQPYTSNQIAECFKEINVS